MKNIANPTIELSLQKEFKAYPTQGVTSIMSFENPLFWKAIEELFGVRYNEKLIGINLDEHGITARFVISK